MSAMDRTGAAWIAHRGSDELSVARRRRSAVTLTDAVHDFIVDQVLALVLAPGSVINLERLALECRAPKSVVRRALHRLVTDGLASQEADGSYRITPLSSAEEDDLRSLEAILVSEAAGLAARAGCAVGHLDDLGARLRAGFDAGDTDSIVAFLGAHDEFHLALAELSGNQRLVTVLRATAIGLRRYRHHDLATQPDLASRCAEAMATEQRRLLDAIAAADEALARSAATATATVIA